MDVITKGQLINKTNYWIGLILFTTVLQSCLFGETQIQNQSSVSGNSSSSGSSILNNYTKFTDFQTCSGGAVLTYNGTTFTCVSAGVTTQTNITSGGSSYLISNSQDKVMLVYNDSVDGVISLPAISSVQNGFQVTIARQVPHKVLIQTNGSDSFQNKKTDYEMIANNAATVVVAAVQGKWQLVHQMNDCNFGESCWGQKQIFAGVLNGHQYFTTPSGCTDSATPVCDGSVDILKKMWANNSGTTAYGVETGANSYIDGKTQSAMLATSYTDTDAAKFCENMSYDGYTDWYLPSYDELELLYSTKLIKANYVDWDVYWSSTQYRSDWVWVFDPQYKAYEQVYGYSKNYSNLVRCIRRF